MKFITEHPNWYEVTKRFPRVTPRYRNEPPQFVGLSSLLGLGLQQASPEQMAALYSQQFQNQQYNPAMYQPFAWPFGRF